MCDSISERVRFYLIEQGETLASIARKTGLPKSTLNPWLKGKRHITTSTFDVICKAYEICVFRPSGPDSDHVATLAMLSRPMSTSDWATAYAEIKAARQLAQRRGDILNDLLKKLTDIMNEGD